MYRHARIFFLGCCLFLASGLLAGTFYVTYQKKYAPAQVQGKSTIRLFSNLHFVGSKEMLTRATPVSVSMLEGKQFLEVTYNLHGLCLLPGLSSAITFTDTDSGQNYSISLSDYAQLCKDGIQTIAIALADFGLSKERNLDTFSISFWYPTSFRIDVLDVSLTSSTDVLGVKIPQKEPDELFKYGDITPIYDFPYAQENIPDEF